MKYYHIKKSDIPAMLAAISRGQAGTKTFYNVSVLPYRGRKLDPAEYVTIKIG